MSWLQFLFLLDRAPRIYAILRELWAVLMGGPEPYLDFFLKDLENAARAVKLAKSEDERREAARRLSVLIARL